MDQKEGTESYKNVESRLSNGEREVDLGRRTSEYSTTIETESAQKSE